MAYLETKRIILRNVINNEEDTNEFLNIDSDPEVMKFLSDGRPSTLSEVQTAVPRLVALNERHEQKLGFWLAALKVLSRHFGNFIKTIK